jgi:outer membrane protein TolC
MLSKTLTAIGAAALALIVAAGTAPAAFAQAEEPGALRLSLEEAVRVALERNLSLSIQQIDPRIAAQSLTIAEAAFDSDIFASASHEESESEPSSAFSALGDESDEILLSWTDPNPLGGQLQTTLSYGDTLTNYSVVALEEFRFIPEQQIASLSATYTQSLLRNFGFEINRTAIEQAKNDLQFSESELRGAIIDTVAAVEQSYWLLSGAERALEVARGSLDLAEEFLGQTRIRVEVGTLPPIDITTAEANVASREESVIIAEKSLEDARDQLRALLRMPIKSPDWQRPLVPAEPPQFEPMEVDLEQSIDNALRLRPEIRQGQLAIKNRVLAERFQRNQVRPDLVFTGTVRALGNSFDYVGTGQFQVTRGPDGIPGTDDDRLVEILAAVEQGASETFREIPDFDNNYWRVQLDFRMPIRNRAAKAAYARARLATEQAELLLEDTEQFVILEVREAVRAVKAAARRVAAARANVVLQRRKLDAEQKRYENGMSTAFAVLEFQEDLREAELAEIRAVVDYNNSLVELGRVDGTLLTQRGVRVPA